MSGLRRISANQFGLVQHDAGHLVIEASTFELKPGEFPTVIETDIGNGKPFGLVELNGERAKYRQVDGICKLTILND